MPVMTALSPQQRNLLNHPSVHPEIRGLADRHKIKSQKPSFYSSKPAELVAHYKDVKDLIRTGDASWYRGVKPWSLAIRAGTQSMVSHAGNLGVENGTVFNIDTCELVGCRKRSFEDLVKEEHAQNWYTGQWYWGAVAPEYRERYDEEKAWNYLSEKIGSKYGHIAILFVAASLMPGFRELLFLRWGNSIEKDWKNIVPYCSILQNLAAIEGSSVDPCPGRSLQLTTPQDTWQSLFWGPKIALIL